jgi:4-nitrophenyl phosphatase
MDYSAIKALLLDMDGVVWRGPSPLGDLASIFRSLAERGYLVGFATNNATATVQAVQAKLAGFGVQAPLETIMTSSVATAAYLKERFPQGGDVYVVGEDGLKVPLAEAGFPHQEASAHYVSVVVGLDRQFTYEKLKRANQIIREGVLFLASNPDKTFPAPNGLVPGAGSVVAAVETASETAPVIIGKPSSTLFDILMQRLHVSPENVLVVGDRYDTDILGGMNANCRTALVLSGVTTREQAENYLPAPDVIADDLTALIGRLP